MNLPKSAPEHVAQLLNQWYLSIEQDDLEESGDVKEEVEGLLDGMDEDQNVLLYYSLLDYRYQTRLKEHESRHVQSDMDALLSYYFYFYQGMHAYKIRAYEEAINCYQEAEKRLKFVTDDIEKGEFYYKVASVLYHIYRTEMSLEFAKKALAIFERDPHYTKRTAHSKLIIALNLMTLKEFTSAEDFLNQAWKTAAEEKDEGLQKYICHNFGLLYREKGEPEATLEWLFKLKKRDKKVLYLLAEASCLLNQKADADKWIEEGMHLCRQLNDREYWHCFRILKVRYGDYHPRLFEKILEEAIAYFREEGLWQNVEENASYLIDFFLRNGRTEEAAEYKSLVELAQEKLAEEIEFN